MRKTTVSGTWIALCSTLLGCQAEPGTDAASAAASSTDPPSVPSLGSSTTVSVDPAASTQQGTTSAPASVSASDVETAQPPATTEPPTSSAPPSSTPNDSTPTATGVQTISSTDTASSPTASVPPAPAAATPIELPVGTAPPVVSGLTITANPNNVLSCIVTWTTDVPARSEVQFGDGGYEFKIQGDAAATQHRVLVIGMVAETEYQIKAVSTNSAGVGEQEDAFTTGVLPDFVSLASLTVNTPASQDGWTLTNLEVEGGTQGTQSKTPAIAVMYNHDGVPVWYYVNGETADTRGDVSMELTAENTIIIGPTNAESPREVDLEGNTLWVGPDQIVRAGFGGGGGGGGGGLGGGGAMAAGAIDSPAPMSHHANKLANGNYIVLWDESSAEYGVTGSRIEELTKDNAVVWSWSLFDHYPPGPQASSDWCHGNSVSVDLESDTFLLNCRFLGTFKARRSDGEILWHMGSSIDPDAGGDVSYDPPEAQFSDTHDPELHSDGTILVYDNGGYRQLSGGMASDYHSRVLEFALDEQTKQATRVWEFPGQFSVDAWYSEQWYTPFWGDADRLDNGNVLITAGVRGAGAETHIFEVTRQGEVVWEIVLEPDNGSYRAQRLSPPPLVQRIE